MSLSSTITRATPDPARGTPQAKRAAEAPRLQATSPTTHAFESPGRSLRVACLAWVGLWSVGLFMNNVVGPLVSPDQPMDDAWPWPANPIAFGCILVSLALFVVSKRTDLPPSRLIDLSLLYEIVLAAGIGIVNQWTPNTVGLSWIVVVILVHPLLVPAPMGKTLAASLIAASMDPVGLAVASTRGLELPAPAVLVWTYLPNYLCALLAVFPARVRMRMEEHHSRARELGSYRVGELLSRGGMGEIYKAEHRMLVRPAAAKIIRPEVLGGLDEDGRRRILDRFQREAKVTAGLRSPHTVAVYDFGISPDGTLYYVMELLDGLDFEALVQRFGPLPAERAVHLLLQVCDSLGEAHECGLIHRDIKPSNVWLSHYGSRVDFVKVLDFGLARRADLGQVESHLTVEATVLGTPAFMAPEQIIGTTEVGPRTDLYAVGCLAYWLLTGQRVFAGDRMFEVLDHHLHTAPVPPSRRSELEIPEALDRVVMACLEKDPARRPPSAEALADMLQGIQPLPPWTSDRARHWWEQHLPSALTPSLTL
ncbi:MAG: serine/threonine-protein kinase [Vicinamibacterales bacterium]